MFFLFLDSKPLNLFQEAGGSKLPFPEFPFQTPQQYCCRPLEAIRFCKASANIRMASKEESWGGEDPPCPTKVVVVEVVFFFV